MFPDHLKVIYFDSIADEILFRAKTVSVTNTQNLSSVIRDTGGTNGQKTAEVMFKDAQKEDSTEQQQADEDSDDDDEK